MNQLNYAEILKNFGGWLTRRKYPIDEFTSEFTIQFWLAIFLDGYLSKKYQIELEVNTKKYGIINSTKKKEIDMVVSSGDEKHALELKYLRDPLTIPQQMYSVCEDVLFLEQLKDDGFSSTCALVITRIPDRFQPKGKIPWLKNRMNSTLYQRFREERKLFGTIALKSGSIKKMKLTKEHKFEWHDFLSKAKATTIL